MPRDRERNNSCLLRKSRCLVRVHYRNCRRTRRNRFRKNGSSSPAHTEEAQQNTRENYLTSQGCERHPRNHPTHGVRVIQYPELVQTPFIDGRQQEYRADYECSCADHQSPFQINGLKKSSYSSILRQKTLTNRERLG